LHQIVPDFHTIYDSISVPHTYHNRTHPVSTKKYSAGLIAKAWPNRGRG
jgi:hypothetical protein